MASEYFFCYFAITYIRNIMATHPQWALKHKQKGTELRCINGYYYLYEVTSKWDPDKKRSKKITGRLLGKITRKDGFVESEKERLRKQRVTIENVKIKEYGVWSFIESHLADYTGLIKKHFPGQWETIMGLVYGRLLYQSPLKNMGFHFQHSYMSEQFFDIDLSAKRLGQFLKELGYKRDVIVDFFKEFKTANDCILFDGSDFCSESKKMGLCEFGMSKKGIYQQLVNTMFIFSVRQQLPIYYRLLPGNIKDVKAFKLCLKESGVKDATIIADKGFYSKANIERLDQESLAYIIPLRRDNTLINYGKLSSNDKKNFEGYFEFENRFVWYYTLEIKKENKKVYVYLDEELKTNEQKDYLLRVDKKIEGYSIEQFYEKQKAFGSIALYSNTSKTPKEIYIDYKSRNEIEGMIDTLKNVLESDKTYMQNEQSLEGWMFINYIALHWYYRVYQLLVKNDLNGKYSPYDLLQMLKEIRKVKINEQWYTGEIIQRTIDLLSKLKIPIT